MTETEETNQRNLSIWSRLVDRCKRILKKEETASGSNQSGVKKSPETFVQEYELEQLLVAHYKRVKELKVSDYDETEERVMEILGKDLFKYIVLNKDKSEIILYHLGKQPRKALPLIDLWNSDPDECSLEIDKLINHLTLKRRYIPPLDPPNQVEGGIPGGPPLRKKSGESRSSTTNNSIESERGPEDPVSDNEQTDTGELSQALPPRKLPGIAKIFPLSQDEDKNLELWQNHASQASRNGLVKARTNKVGGSAKSEFDPLLVGDWLVEKTYFARDKVNRRLAANLELGHEDLKEFFLP